MTDFVGDLRRRNVTPHIAVNGTVSKLEKTRKTAIDEATASHPGHAISQRCRKRIEEVFGWIKAAAGFASVKVRGNPAWTPPSPSPSPPTTPDQVRGRL